MTVNVKKTSDKDGEATIKFGEKIGVIITYSGVDKAKFGGKEISVGSYTVKYNVSSASVDSEMSDLLNNMTFTVSSAVENGTAKSSISVDAKDYIKFDLKTEATPSDDVSDYKIPTDVIDFTSALNSGTLDEATTEELKAYATELVNGIVNAFEGTDLEGILSQYAQGITQQINADEEAIAGAKALEEKVYADMMEVYDWYRDYDVYSGEAYDNAEKYQDSLRDLDDRIWSAYQNCTKEQLKAFTKEYKTLNKQKASLEKAIKAASKIGNTSGNTSNNSSASSNTSNTSNTHETSAA